MAFDANDLSPHEHFVVDRTRDGEVADFTPMIGAGGQRPSVRAGFLRKLLLGLDSSWTVRATGVRLKGVRIEGVLDLTDCSGAAGSGLPALSLDSCELWEPVDLSRARLARVAFRHCRLRGLIGAESVIDGALDLSDVAPRDDELLTVRLRGAQIGGDVIVHRAKLARPVESNDLDVLSLAGAEIGGDVLLDDGFEAFGCVRLDGASIGGNLRCDGGVFLNRSDDTKGQAISASAAHIDGGASLREKFKAEGEVNFAGAHIGADFDCTGGLIRNETGAGLVLNNAEIGGQLLGAAKISGQAQLQGASIARNLDLRGAEIANPRRKSGGTVQKSDYDTAIDAASLRVGGAALFQGANVKGEVFLADARIEGYLAFGGGRFISPGAWAIRAPNVRVGGNLTLKIEEGGFAPHGQKSVIEGGAKFDRAQIAGAAAWNNLEMRGPGPDGKGAVVSFADASIAGPLQARALTTQHDARIDLSGARCAALEDDLKSGWGVERAALDLEGFSYGRIDAQHERWRPRLAWLKRARREHFSPQPYTQLAQVYARAGQRDDARRVLLAQHDQRTLHAHAGPLTWALSSLFGLVAGYGFAPIRAARALALFLAIGVLGVMAMNAQGALVRADGAACNGAVDPALYAVDVALPVVDLGQESRCRPGRSPRADLFAGISVDQSDWRLFEGAALWKWAQALYAVLGAILTALAALTFSGVMKPKEE